MDNTCIYYSTVSVIVVIFCTLGVHCRRSSSEKSVAGGKEVISSQFYKYAYIVISIRLSCQTAK